MKSGSQFHPVYAVPTCSAPEIAVGLEEDFVARPYAQVAEQAFFVVCLSGVVVMACSFLVQVLLP